MALFLVAGLFFFFKQKTAYEMRISDWSSDVCSSDLLQAPQRPPQRAIDQPEAEARRIDLDPARRFIGREIIGEAPNPERRLVEPPETPHAHAAERQILMRVAAMRELPVEHRGKPFGAHHHIAHTIVAMHRSAEHTSERQSLMSNS